MLDYARHRARMIPSQFHFVFGLRDRPEPLHLVFYLCLESCRRLHPSSEILLHCHHEPHGPYWERIREHAAIRVVPVTPDPFIASFAYPDRALDKYRYAHHADVIRLDALIRHGGIYADIDTIFLKPVPEHLLRQPFVIGREDDVWCHRSRQLQPSLCNAFLASEPASRFALAWREQLYGAFDGSWSNHIGFLSHRLSQQMPDDVHVEPPRTFFRHGFRPAGVRRLLESLDDDFDGMVSMHLWSHLWWDRRRRDYSHVHAGMLTEDYIRTTDTTFTVAARPFLPQPAAPPRAARTKPATVSVVIPTHNRSAWLAEAVDSVLAQSHPAHEIVIVDDGSEDEHRSALTTIAERSPLVRIHALPGHEGRSSARNEGLARATGDYVIFLDDDDLLGRDLIASALRTIASGPPVDAVVALSRRFGEIDPSADPPLNPFWTDSEAAPHSRASAWMGVAGSVRNELERHPVRLLSRCLPATNAFVVRREAIGATRFSEDLHCGEDRVFWLELAARGCSFRLNAEGRVYVRERRGRSQSRASAVAACRRTFARLAPLGRHEAFLSLAFWARTCWLEGRSDWWRPAARLARYPDLFVKYGRPFLARCAFRFWSRASAGGAWREPSLTRLALPTRKPDAH